MGRVELLRRLCYQREREALASLAMHVVGNRDVLGEDALTLLLKKDALKRKIGLAGFWTVYFGVVKEMSSDEIRRELFGEMATSAYVRYPVRKVVLVALQATSELLGGNG